MRTWNPINGAVSLADITQSMANVGNLRKGTDDVEGLQVAECHLDSMGNALSDANKANSKLTDVRSGASEDAYKTREITTC